MRFYEIIRSNNWLTIELTFIKLFPEQMGSIENYRLMYEALKFLQPIESDMEIVLGPYDNDGQPSVVDVSGRNPHPEPEDFTNSLALEFTSWDKWLGMDIDALTLKEFTVQEIICHCMNEMTYAGFDEENIKSVFSKLKSIVDEYKVMTPEQKAKHTISHDELKRRISYKNLNSDE